MVYVLPVSSPAQQFPLRGLPAPLGAYGPPSFVSSSALLSPRVSYASHNGGVISGEVPYSTPPKGHDVQLGGLSTNGGALHRTPSTVPARKSATRSNHGGFASPLRSMTPCRLLASNRGRGSSSPCRMVSTMSWRQLPTQDPQMLQALHALGALPNALGPLPQTLPAPQQHLQASQLPLTPATPYVPPQPPPLVSPRGELEAGALIKIGECNCQITSPLGMGSFGAVWAADCAGGGEVAIKEIICRSPEDLSNAAYEGQLLEMLSGVAQVDGAGLQFPWKSKPQSSYSSSADACLRRIPSFVASETERVGPETWRVRLAMSRITGEPLDRFLERRRRQNWEAGPVQGNAATLQFVEACHFARELLVQLVPAFEHISTFAYHRDVNSHNILVADGEGHNGPSYGLVDFGLAVDAKHWQGEGFGLTPAHQQQRGREEGSGAWQHLDVGGDCRYWPVSAWLQFELGWRELAATPALCFEYQTRLDLHGLGITALQVLSELLPPVPENSDELSAAEGEDGDQFTHLIGVLQAAWDRYWENVTRFWKALLDTFRSNGDWNSLKVECINTGVHNIIRSDLHLLCMTLADCGEACRRAPASLGLGEMPPVFDVLANLVGAASSPIPEDLLRGADAWRRIRSILGIVLEEAPVPAATEREERERQEGGNSSAAPTVSQSAPLSLAGSPGHPWVNPLIASNSSGMGMPIEAPQPPLMQSQASNVSPPRRVTLDQQQARRQFLPGSGMPGSIPLPQQLLQPPHPSLNGNASPMSPAGGRGLIAPPPVPLPVSPQFPLSPRPITSMMLASYNPSLPAHLFHEVVMDARSSSVHRHASPLPAPRMAQPPPGASPLQRQRSERGSPILPLPVPAPLLVVGAAVSDRGVLGFDPNLMMDRRSYGQRSEGAPFQPMPDSRASPSSFRREIFAVSPSRTLVRNGGAPNGLSPRSPSAREVAHAPHVLPDVLGAGQPFSVVSRPSATTMGLRRSDGGSLEQLIPPEVLLAQGLVHASPRGQASPAGSPRSPPFAPADPNVRLARWGSAATCGLEGRSKAPAVASATGAIGPGGGPGSPEQRGRSDRSHDLLLNKLGNLTEKVDQLAQAMAKLKERDKDLANGQGHSGGQQPGMLARRVAHHRQERAHASRRGA